MMATVVKGGSSQEHPVSELWSMIEPENMVRLDGRRCIGLEIYKEARHNTIDAVDSIHEQLEVLRRSLPGYQIETVQDQARFIEAAVTEVEQAGMIGIALAVLVLFVFLRRIGLTAVVSIGIPISIVATFNLMYFGDLSLNLMTLGGLALGAGMLVDNAIVVVESIFRRLERGSSLTEAAVEGTAEVASAITSSTLTTIIVFSADRLSARGCRRAISRAGVDSGLLADLLALRRPRRAADVVQSIAVEGANTLEWRRSFSALRRPARIADRPQGRGNRRRYSPGHRRGGFATQTG